MNVTHTHTNTHTHTQGWKDKFEAAEKERKRLHNQVLELKGNIRVFCRVRPQLKHESGAGCDNAIFFKVDSLKKRKVGKSPKKTCLVICVGKVPLYSLVCLDTDF